jgi:hypothetical protein
MADPYYTPSGNPAQGSDGDSSVLRTEFGLIETGIEVLNTYALNVHWEDANTAGSRYIAVPWSCQIESVSIVIDEANGTTDTVFTLEIGGVEVTFDAALTIADTDIKGGQVTALATALRGVAAFGAIEVITDGGGSTVMPARVGINVSRT